MASGSYEAGAAAYGGPSDDLYGARSGRSAGAADRLKDASTGSRLPERLFLVVAVLLAYSLQRFVPSQSISQGLWSFFDLIALAGVVAERETAIRLLRGSLPVVFVTLIALCSAVWSESPVLTVEKSLGLLGTGVLSLFFVCRLGLKRFVETLAIALMITAALSAIVIVLFPAVGLMQDEDVLGNWQGIFSHKTTLGLSMVLSMVTVACVIDQARGIKRLLQIAAFALFVVLLVGSRSITGVTVAGALVLIFPLLLRSRAVSSVKPLLLAALAVCIATLTAALMGFNFDGVLEAFGKDSTLTGRTGLWQFAIDAVGQRPVLGYGYEAFFDPDSATGQEVVRGIAWDAGMAHNGFLEIALSIGIVGVLFAVAAFIVGIRRGFALFWDQHDLSSMWPLLAMLYSLFSNFTEAGIARINDVNWIVFLAAFFFATDASQRRLAATGPGLLERES